MGESYEMYLWLPQGAGMIEYQTPF